MTNSSSSFVSPFRITVAGGTSGPGVPLVELLQSNGRDVRVLSRKPGNAHFVGDLSKGVGLDAAVADADVVVHLATNGKRDLPGTKALLAAAQNAGVGHFVYLSIVGVDKIPFPYYRDKFANENLIAESGMPFTILRATQFHSFPNQMLAMTGGHFFVNLPVQTIGVNDVATRLAEITVAPPAGRVADIGGPEILEGRDILGRLQAAKRAKKPVFKLSLPGKTFAAFRAGHHMPGLPGYGTQTFDDWLASGERR